AQARSCFSVRQPQGCWRNPSVRSFLWWLSSRARAKFQLPFLAEAAIAPNLLLVRNRSGRTRPASLRLPRQAASSFRERLKLRPALSIHVSPSLPLNVVTSDSVPSL